MRFILLLICNLIPFVYTQFWNPSSSFNRCYGRYEQYNECGTACPDTCQDIWQYNPMKICNMMCRIGCECRRPFVRLNQNPSSRCVNPMQCRFVRG